MRKIAHPKYVISLPHYGCEILRLAYLYVCLCVLPRAYLKIQVCEHREISMHVSEGLVLFWRR